MGKTQSLILSMVKVGMIGFGGGNALIPVMEQEVVKEKELVTKEDFDKDTIAATMTPGALPVEIAAGVGFQSNGIRGMVAAGTAMALPGAVLTVLFLTVFFQIGGAVLDQIQYASVGVTGFIMCLLTQYILDTLQRYGNSRYRVMIWIIILGVFLATGTHALLGIFHLPSIGIPRLSTIHLLLLTLFGSTVVYLFRKFLLRRTEKKEKVACTISWKSLIGRIAVWVLFFVLLSAPAFFFVGRAVVFFDIQGLASSFLSFGGGDAYLSIADGLFIPEYISENEFYNHLVLLVNVLPGSILCKTLSGIGYVYGFSLTHTMLGGVLMAVAGYACSVAASCAVFYVALHLYDRLEQSGVFVIVRKAIRVVVSGLLITVMVSLVKSGIDCNVNAFLPRYTVLGIMIILYSINMILYHKCKCNNLIRAVISLAVALVLCNVIGV